MNILFITLSLTRSSGGLFNSVSGLAKALQAAGHEIEVFGPADATFEEDKANWGRVPLRAFEAPSGYGWRTNALKDLHPDRFDLVHLHGIWRAGSAYSRAITVGGTPLVISPRGMLDPWILARGPLVKRVHAALFERPLMRRAHMHALCESERDAICKFMPTAAPRTFVVPNGVPEAPTPNPHLDRSGALFLGRLHEKKQVLELVRAWRGSGLPEDFKLTIAGWGEAAYEAAVRDAAAGAANIEFVGSLYGTAKTEALSRAKFFILPSLSEGLPMAVLEAIQHGCIPIITEQCNLPELVHDGIAIPMRADFADFAGVLQRLRNLPTHEARKRSENSVSYARNYLWGNVAKSMIAAYERVLRSNP